MMPVSLLPVLLVFVSAGPAAKAPFPAPEAIAVQDACATVTRAEVQTALGQTVDFTMRRSRLAESNCDYTAENGLILTVTLEHSSAALDFEAQLKALKKTFADARLERVHGIGKRAFLVDLPGFGTQIYVIRGDHDYLAVSVLGMNNSKVAGGVALAIARKALARL